MSEQNEYWEIEVDMDKIPQNHHPLLDKLMHALADAEGDVGFNCLGILHSSLAHHMIKQNVLSNDVLFQMLLVMVSPISDIARSIAGRRPELIDRLSKVDFLVHEAMAVLKGEPNVLDKMGEKSAPEPPASAPDPSSDVRQRIASMTQ